MLQLLGLSKSFGDTPVFHNVGFTVARGEFVALVGESGVGKSTLLNCIAGLERPDSGQLQLAGQDLLALDEDARARLRRAQLGFVFQAFHVLPHLSVAENVSLPLLLLGRPDAARVQAVLEAVGLGAFSARMPAQLSGGQLQRVAIARAVVQPRPDDRRARAVGAGGAGARQRRRLPAGHAFAGGHAPC
jgi:putative ABC transport system ATP-binding protein